MIMSGVPLTYGQLVYQRKKLIRQRKPNQAFDDAISQQIADIDKLLESKVNRDDQNFLRVFCRTARELLDPNDFNRIEEVASTRSSQYKSKNTKRN